MSSLFPPLSARLQPLTDTARPVDAAKLDARRRRRVNRVFLIGASYGVDCLLLLGFAAAGVAHWSTVAVYLALSLSATLTFWCILRRPQADNYRDPYLATWQVAAGLATLVIGLHLEPGLAFFFLGGMFVVFAFATLRLSLKETLVAWIAVSAAIIPVFSPDLGPSTMRGFDAFASLLAALSFALFLGRCILAGYFSYWLRVSYHGRSLEADAANQQLERRVAERTSELTRANVDLEHANTQLQAHAYAMAHEFRAPLRAIDGFTGLLGEEYAGKPLDAEAADLIARTRKASNRMAGLVDDLAHLATVSRAVARPQPVDLVPIAGPIIEACRVRFPERQVDWVHPPTLHVMADPDLARVALGVLIDNAWKFTAHVAVARIELGVAEQDGGSEVFLCDNGVGFDRAYADKLFGIFQRLHAGDEYEGNGIGLAMFERIVNLHGGRVRAEGVPGAGACFYFTLPGESP